MKENGIWVRSGAQNGEPDSEQQSPGDAKHAVRRISGRRQMVIFVVGGSWDSPRNSNVCLAKVFFFTPLSPNTTILTLCLLKYLQASGAIALVEDFWLLVQKF